MGRANRSCPALSVEILIHLGIGEAGVAAEVDARDLAIEFSIGEKASVRGHELKTSPSDSLAASVITVSLNETTLLKIMS